MSLKEIAEIVGVSAATVSRVLNDPDHHCSSDETRKRIWTVARQLNYTPNFSARNLKLGIENSRSRIQYIDVLLTRPGALETDGFFSELLKILQSEVPKKNCILSSVENIPAFSDETLCKRIDMERKLLESGLSRNANGLIIMGKCYSGVLSLLKKQYKNIVSLNRNATNFAIDEICCNGSQIASTAVEYLISLGHRHIGYIGDTHSESRYRGFQTALFKHHLNLDPEFIIPAEHTESAGLHVMETLLKKTSELPTAYYCATDSLALGMLRCLSQSRNRYYSPSIIGSDDITQAQYSKPMLSTIHLPKEEMVKFTLDLLLDRINGGHQNNVSIIMEGKLLVRESTSLVENSRCVEYYI